MSAPETASGAAMAAMAATEGATEEVMVGVMAAAATENA
jgi:hypothetical protein